MVCARDRLQANRVQRLIDRPVGRAAGAEQIDRRLADHRRGHCEGRSGWHQMGHRPKEGAFDVVPLGITHPLDGPPGRTVLPPFDGEIERVTEDGGVPVHAAVVTPECEQDLALHHTHPEVVDRLAVGDGEESGRHGQSHPGSERPPHTA